MYPISYKVGTFIFLPNRYTEHTYLKVIKNIKPPYIGCQRAIFHYYGKVEYVRTGATKRKHEYTFIDPEGGPLLEKGHYIPNTSFIIRKIDVSSNGKYRLYGEYKLRKDDISSNKK